MYYVHFAGCKAAHKAAMRLCRGSIYEALAAQCAARRVAIRTANAPGLHFMVNTIPYRPIAPRSGEESPEPPSMKKERKEDIEKEDKKQTDDRPHDGQGIFTV